MFILKQRNSIFNINEFIREKNVDNSFNFNINKSEINTFEKT